MNKLLPIMHTSNSFLFHFFTEKLSKSLTVLRVYSNTVQGLKKNILSIPKSPDNASTFFQSALIFFFFGIVSFFKCAAAAQHTWYICIVWLWYFQLFLLLTKKWTLLSSFKLQLFAMLLFVYGWFKFLYDIQYTYYHTDKLI